MQHRMVGGRKHRFLIEMDRYCSPRHSELQFLIFRGQSMTCH